jgi:TonB family protein
MQRWRANLLYLLVALLGAISTGCGDGPSAGISLNDSDVGAAKFANHVVIPVYPDSSIHAGREGVTVVAVIVNRNGVVSQVFVLQAPDQGIADSCKAAARRTTFSLPRIDGVQYTGSGKLYYYFKLRPVPHVEIPGVGR